MQRRTGISIVLVLALAGSLLFHLGALLVPELELGMAAEEEETPLLEARIRLPAPVAAPLPPKPSPVPASRQVAKALTEAPRVPVPGNDAVAATPAAAPAAEALPSPAAPAPPPLALPDKGGILYDVTLGPGGLRVGRAVHRWEFSEGRYRIYVMTETAGIAAFFKNARMEYESRGTITAAGLQPETFTAIRNGAEPGDTARFDWGLKQVTISRSGKTSALSAGAQDFASFYYQLVVLPDIGEGLAMGVATARKFQQYRFDVLGEEEVVTDAGTFRTQHLRVQTDMTLDLWLALDRQRLPIKIRYTDRKGEALEQVAVAFSDKSPI